MFALAYSLFCEFVFYFVFVTAVPQAKVLEVHIMQLLLDPPPRA